MRSLLTIPVIFSILLLPAALFAQDRDTTCNGAAIRIKVFLVGHEETTSLAVDEIIASGRLQAAVKGFQITSYQFGMQDGSSGYYHQMLVRGDALPDSVIHIIKRMPRGGRVFFDCIQARNTEGKKYSLTPVTYLITKAAIKN